MAFLLFDPPDVMALGRLGALRGNMGAAVDRPLLALDLPDSAPLDRAVPPLDLPESARFGRTLTAFDLASSPFDLPESTCFGRTLAPFYLAELLARRTFGAFPSGSLGADLLARLAAFGTLAAALLLRLLRFLLPFGLLAMPAALGLGRSGNGERRHGGDQECSGHGLVPVGGCLLKAIPHLGENRLITT